MQRADRAGLRLNAQRPAARIESLCRRQAEALRRLDAAWQRRLERDQARLRNAAGTLRAGDPRRRVQQLRQRLAALAPRPQAAVVRRLADEARQLRGLARSLEAVSPLATVARGYAILQREDGRLVRSATQVAAGDRVDARVSDGTIALRVVAK